VQSRRWKTEQSLKISKINQDSLSAWIVYSLKDSESEKGLRF